MAFPLASPAQPFPSNKTALVAAKKKSPPMHPAAKQASESWARLHGHKFHANAHKNKK